MSEEQRQPAKKWYKKLSNIIILSVVCVVAILLVWVYNNTSSTGKGPTTHQVVYNSIREDVQNAFTAYINQNDGKLPTLNGTYTNAECSLCKILNISALLVKNGGTLREAPDGLNLSAIGNDNCDGNANLGCENGSSYIWIADSNGTVYSYCIGVSCETNNSGYQGVWP
jgi:hypothetical protein